jgi:beta-fructofuranosidase
MSPPAQTRLSSRIRASWRPRYHVTGKRNWINDPNGPILVEGRYHLFYQANEDAPFWGPPSWGHISSDDLVSWSRHSTALAPEPGGPDADGCWSGCTRIVDGRPAIYYSGIVGEDEARVESVCRAWGSPDLLRWERDPANPLISGPPPGRRSGYHRDPFLWHAGDGWHMLLGSGTMDGERHGQILRYDSPDAASWSYGGVFFDGPRRAAGIDLGELWECPQLMFVDGAVALIVSCQFPREARSLAHCVTFIGEIFDGCFHGQLHGLLDHGDVFYAPLVCEGTDGRALLWGWTQEHLPAEIQAQLSHAGALSVPREVRLRGDRLWVMPAPEITHLRERELPFDAGHNGRRVLSARPQMELLATFAGSTGRAGWELSDATGDVVVSIVADATQRHVEVTVYGPRYEHRAITAPLDGGEHHQLRVLIDGSLLEIFTDEGRSLTTRAYPGSGSWEQARLVSDPTLGLVDARAWALTAEAIR